MDFLDSLHLLKLGVKCGTTFLRNQPLVDLLPAPRYGGYRNASLSTWGGKEIKVGHKWHMAVRDKNHIFRALHDSLVPHKWGSIIGKRMGRNGWKIGKEFTVAAPFNVPENACSGQFISRPQTFVKLQLRFKLHFYTKKMQFET